MLEDISHYITITLRHAVVPTAFPQRRIVNMKKKKKAKRNTKTDGTTDKNRTYGTTFVELFKKRIPTSE
jgi:hypothetical protein